VTVHYDPLLAKIVAFGPTRDAALERLVGALGDALVHGVVTNLPFVRALARSRAMADAAFDTEWIEREFLAGFSALMTAPVPELAMAAAAIAEAIGSDRTGVAAAPGADGSRPRPRLAPPFESAGHWRLPGLDE
jgi:acetyl/propionyl-CoA carboxylase alpha subunit